MKFFTEGYFLPFLMLLSIFAMIIIGDATPYLFWTTVVSGFGYIAITIAKIIKE